MTTTTTMTTTTMLLQRQRRRRCIVSSAAGAKLSTVLVGVVLIYSILAAGNVGALNSDGLLLLSFKASILSDPLSVLSTWHTSDETPCSWRGVACSPTTPDVTALSLPRSRLLGSVPADLSRLPRLRRLDLSDNFLNGTLPEALFNSSDLLSLSLANNEISGPLPSPAAGALLSLQSLNLSDNALSGPFPAPLSALPNLTLLSLRNNYLSGPLPRLGFRSLQLADLSSNLFEGPIPLGFAGGSLRSLNLSSNRLSGAIPPEFFARAPATTVVDLSFNNLSGPIPSAAVLRGQGPGSFDGNPDLCGRPLKNPCSIPSSLSTPPNVSTTSTSSPAIAAFPRGGAGSGNVTQQDVGGGLRPGTIAGIVVGDLAGIGVISVVFLYLYHTRKKNKSIADMTPDQKKVESANQWHFGLWCLRKKGENSSSSSSNDGETTETETDEEARGRREKEEEQSCNPGKGRLVTVDGEPKLELETLLKASAYVLGASGPNIVYKAVLEDGTTFAVRRIGESSMWSLREFESQVRVIVKMRHPNILRIRGFYWGADDKLLIFDYAPNGSLASAALKKQGSSSTPCYLSWDIRLRIARGVARGLTYLHEKRHVHGNLKPSNVLLDAQMEPKISDFGMDRLALGNDPSNQTSGSAWQSTGKKSSFLGDNQQDVLPKGTSNGASVSVRCALPYNAPESLKHQKPSPKWDVYSFGIILLELLSGKVFSDRELSGSIGSSSNEWNVVLGEKNHVLKMADAALREEMEGKEEALVACFQLAFSCASVTPQKRPSMKEALQILDKIPSSTSSSQ